MTQIAGEHQPAIIVTDSSVLINFSRIDRTDLLAGHSHAFIATDHVAAEITGRYPDQQQRFAAALEAGAISETRVTTPEEIRLFGSMFAAGRLGAGEFSALALAIDDRLATTHARRADATLRILATQDLVVSMIRPSRPHQAGVGHPTPISPQTGQLQRPDRVTLNANSHRSAGLERGSFL